MSAKLQCKNITDFIFEAARNDEDETFLERTIFLASPEAYAEFIELIYSTPQPNELLRKTMQTLEPLEKE